MNRSTISATYQNVARPVAAMAVEYPSGAVEPPHTHPRAQLIYATSGVMYVTTDDSSWILPPGRALWLPAFTTHAVRFRGDVSFRTLYVKESVVDSPLPRQGQAIAVSNLFAALILEAIELPIEYDDHGREDRVMTLILDEIQRMPVLPLSLPMPTNDRLRRICSLLLQDPTSQHDLGDWAREAGMGRRTLTRHFRSETGMGFGVWRQQLRILEGLSRIALGLSVTESALEAGYQSPSAFTAVFSKTLGSPPSKYRPR